MNHDGMATAELKTIPGVDVSSFQGQPSAWQAEAGKVKWVAVKLTELQANGVPFINPDAAADWAFVRGKRLGRIGYMFAHPSQSTGGHVYEVGTQDNGKSWQ